MKLSELLLYVLENYDYIKQTEENKIDEKLKEVVEVKIPEYLMNKMDKTKYKSKGSVRQGNFCIVPWSCLMFLDAFDNLKNANDLGASKNGFYLAFLFKADMSKVYFSLMQGVSKFTKPKITERAEYIRDILDYSDDYIANNLDLSSSNIKLSETAEKYQLSNIIAKEYSLSDLKAKGIEALLNNDITIMIEKYTELAALLNKIHFFGEVDDIMFSDKIPVEKLSAKDTDLIDDILYEYENNTGSTVNIIKEEKSDYANRVQKTKSTERKEKKTTSTYQKPNPKLGDVGEYFVLQQEKDRLINCGQYTKEALEHVAKTKKNDGCGYDIRSLDKDGNECFIEVKTTKSNFDTNFFITNNEMETLKKYKEKYYIYRVHNVNLKKKTARLTILTYKDLFNEDLFDVSTSIYKVKPY